MAAEAVEVTSHLLEDAEFGAAMRFFGNWADRGTMGRGLPNEDDVVVAADMMK